jgi:hypothetical protein
MSCRLEDTAGRRRAALRRLADASLIREQSAGRFALHDLLRVYAAEQAGLHETQDARHDALTRLLDYYLTAAATAMDTLFPATRHQRPRVPPPAGPDPNSALRPAHAHGWTQSAPRWYGSPPPQAARPGMPPAWPRRCPPTWTPAAITRTRWLFMLRPSTRPAVPATMRSRTSRCATSA